MSEKKYDIRATSGGKWVMMRRSAAGSTPNKSFWIDVAVFDSQFELESVLRKINDE